RELAVQSSNDTLTTTERSYTNQEYSALMSEIDRVTTATQYNGQALLTGGTSAFGGVGSSSSILHIGPNGTSTNVMTLSISGTSSGAIGVSATSVTTQTSATTAISNIDSAIGSMNAMRSNLGAFINRLDSAINNLDNQVHNTQSAESLIRDADFAAESTAFTRNQIMVQSATAMLAQANAVPQNVLSLLR
ncbi:MAG: flagellin, partial [Fibrobacterota bacterium]